MQLQRRQGKIIPWCSKDEAETMERAPDGKAYLISRQSGIIGTVDIKSREIEINEGYTVRNGQVVFIVVVTKEG